MLFVFRPGDCDFRSIYDASVHVITMNKTEYNQQQYGENPLQYGKPMAREWDEEEG